MGILNKIRTLIKIFKIIASNPKSLRLIVSENQIETYKNLVKTKYNLKKGLPKANILDVIPNLDENIKLCYLYGGSLSIDHAILKGLCRRFENCRYLEIGTWRGESILNVSDIANECVSISFSHEEMKKIGLPEKAIKVSGILSKDLPNVKHIEHNSLTYDFSKIGKFDLIFIDGDHSYEGVKKDTENAFKLLRNEKSIIVWHDYIASDIDWPVLAGILDGTPSSKIEFLYYISNTRCAAFIPQFFPTSTFFDRYELPDKIFKEKISATKI